MDWETVLTIIVRSLIGDTNPAAYVYSDDRVAQAIVVAALLVSQDYQFSTVYTFDLSGVNIIPDPTANTSYDPIFIALVTLRAACMFLTNTMQSATLGAMKVGDGDDFVDNSGAANAYKNLISTGPCVSYDNLLNLLTRRNIKGRSVSSPFTSLTSGSPWGGEGIWSERGFWTGFFGGLGGF